MKALSLLANAARRLDRIYPGFFDAPKHNHYRDFGYPETVTFDMVRAMYERNSVAKAAVNKTVKKIWEDRPILRVDPDASEETKQENAIQAHFERIRFWQMLAMAERRSFVGGYSGLILRVADNQDTRAPLDAVSGGIEALVEVIPASARQLQPSEWQQDQLADDYGRPTMYMFDEAAVGDNPNPRKFEIHPSRVVIWSDDGTVHCPSILEAGYNDLVTIEKVVGAGGEGFWKTAAGRLALEVDKEAKAKDIADAMGVPVDKLPDAMNEQVEEFQKGFDQVLMLQGMQAKPTAISLPSPEHFFGIALQSFAAGVDIPVKILLGNITGERASTEDAREFAKTCMGRRSDKSIPCIMAVVDRLIECGALPSDTWAVKWADLTESSMDEKIDRADKMAGINPKMGAGGEIVFTADEIRETIGKEPLTDAEKYDDEGDDRDL